MLLFLEATVVGVLLVLVATAVTKIISRSKNKSDCDCKNWNKDYIMEKALFLSGFLLHILSELSGLNTFYCSNGAACAKR